MDNRRYTHAVRGARRRRVSHRLRLFALIVLGAMFCIALYKVVSIVLSYRQGTTQYENTARLFTTVLPVAAPAESSAAEPIASPAPQQQPAAAPVAAYPFVQRVEVDFDGLIASNPDTCAWILLPDTVINYPVLQAQSDDYYLNHLFDGRTNSSGAIFLASASSPDFTDDITTIFGHNMNNGSMFGTLKRYRKQSYYDEHPVMALHTPDAVYRLDLIAGYVSDPTDLCYTGEFASEEVRENYLNDARQRSTFVSGVEVSPDDRLVALSTCSYETDVSTYVVLGKLTPVAD